MIRLDRWRTCCRRGRGIHTSCRSVIQYSNARETESESASHWSVLGLPAWMTAQREVAIRDADRGCRRLRRAQELDLEVRHAASSHHRLVGLYGLRGEIADPIATNDCVGGWGVSVCECVSTRREAYGDDGVARTPTSCG